jgi:predicted transcriptional regulator
VQIREKFKTNRKTGTKILKRIVHALAQFSNAHGMGFLKAFCIELLRTCKFNVILLVKGQLKKH